MNKHLANILDNHYKLISMINHKQLPIKEILLSDIKEIRNVLEFSSRRKKNDEISSKGLIKNE